MTAAELHDLVKDIPEVWPTGTGYERTAGWLLSSGANLPAHLAVLMFEASVARALEAHHPVVSVYPPSKDKPECRVALLMSSEKGEARYSMHKGPTRLHALIAAYNATKEPRP